MASSCWHWLSPVTGGLKLLALVVFCHWWPQAAGIGCLLSLVASSCWHWLSPVTDGLKLLALVVSCHWPQAAGIGCLCHWPQAAGIGCLLSLVASSCWHWLSPVTGLKPLALVVSCHWPQAAGIGCLLSLMASSCWHWLSSVTGGLELLALVVSCHWSRAVALVVSCHWWPQAAGIGCLLSLVAQAAGIGCLLSLASSCWHWLSSVTGLKLLALVVLWWLKLVHWLSSVTGGSSCWHWLSSVTGGSSCWHVTGGLVLSSVTGCHLNPMSLVMLDVCLSVWPMQGFGGAFRAQGSLTVCGSPKMSSDAG